MKRLFACLLALCCFSFPAFSAHAETESLLRAFPVETLGEERPVFGKNCFSVLLMEASTGEILYENASTSPHPIASVTKIMTLLLVCEAIDDGRISLSDTVTVSENAAHKGGSQIYLEVGEQMSVEDLLKSVVVASANDAAVALGEHLAGSEAAFVAQMNEKSAALGMHTTFLNPTGLDDEGAHESSAMDVALMSRALLSHSWIERYTTIWMDTVRSGAFGLTNTNKLVRFYPGTTGLKTGYTSLAGYCISASARRDEMQLIAVILGAPSSNERNAAAKELLDWGFATYALYTPKTELPASLPVRGGVCDEVGLNLKNEGILIKKADLSRISEEVVLEPELSAPVEAEQSVGEVRYLAGGEVLTTHPIKAAGSVAKANLGFYLKKLICSLFF